MIDYTSDEGFNAALKRAREREAADLRAAAAGNPQPVSRDPNDTMDKRAWENLRRALCGERALR